MRHNNYVLCEYPREAERFIKRLLSAITIGKDEVFHIIDDVDQLRGMFDCTVWVIARERHYTKTWMDKVDAATIYLAQHDIKIIEIAAY